MPDTLQSYRKKRNFTVSPEPSGDNRKSGRRAAGGRFVVQKHAAQRLHYDFRLEWDGALISWAVPKEPSSDPKDRRLAVRVEDHPTDYADFEGIIPQGEYGGGTVMLWDEGTFTPKGDFAAGLEKGSVKVALSGRRLKGGWALVRLKESEDNWLLIKERDEYAGVKRPAAETSVRTGRTMAQIRRDGDRARTRNPVTNAAPQLAEAAGRVPEGVGWLFEVKYDGYRMLSYAADGAVRLVSRGGKDYTARFPDIAAALKKLSAGRSFTCDGEIVVPDESGRSDFGALTRSLRKDEARAAAYVLFDLLSLDGRDLRPQPLSARKAALEKLLSASPGCLVYCRHVEGRGRESYEAAARLGLEGIVAKRADAPYRPGRSGDWLKCKCRNSREFVIGGFTASDKKPVAALLLGVYRDGRLLYVGRAGSGLSEKECARLLKVFRPLVRKTPPFDPPPATGRTAAVWLTPRLVAQIGYAGFTDGARLRQASYLGLRDDKPAGDVRPDDGADKAPQTPARTEAKKRAGKAPAPADTAAGQKAGKKKSAAVCGVTLSHPDRIVYPGKGITKRDIARYYAAAAARMLPHAGGRIVSAVRCHGGAAGACFYKKHPAPGEDVRRVTDGGAEYFCLDTARELVAQVQLGTLEFHVRGSRADDPERPDTLVFDLDPDEGLPPERVRAGAKALKAVLKKLGLKSFVKTSGGKGYHIVVPVTPCAGWDKCRAFCRDVVRLLAAEHPDRYTADMRKAARKGKIFIDWQRNTRGATSAAPYTLRARPGAPVSMPISWKELDTVLPDGIDMDEALARLKKPDPWRGYFSVRQTINP